MKFYNVKSLIVMAALCCSSAFSADATNTGVVKQKPTAEQIAERIQYMKHWAEFSQWEYQHSCWAGDARRRLTDYIYKKFNDESLNTLIKKGDVRAMLTRANGMRHRLKNRVEVIELYKLAAVHGSTCALLRMPSSLGDINNNKLSSEVEHAQLKDQLQWREVALIRGDIYGYADAVYFPQKKGKITPEDFEEAKANAKIIYQELLSRRLALGLGDFDNTVPPGVKVVTERLYGKDLFSKIRTQSL